MAAAVNVAQGKVVSLTGKVVAIAADGSQRILKLGDIVATGERLVVPADGVIELQGSNGYIVKIAEARDLTITDDVFGLQATDATDAAIAPLNPDAQQVLAALESGQDPLQGLEETAAGLAAGGGEDGGNSFVVISRVAESIQPLSLNNQIDTTSTETIQTTDTTTVLVDDSTTVTINNVGPSRDNTPLLTGTGEAGATIVITNAAGQVIATTVVASNGTWSVESTVALPDGNTGLTAVATDTNGNKATSVATAIIDTTTTVTIDNVGPTRDTTPLLSGTGEAGATIVVSDKDGNVIGTATVGTDGRWSVESTRPLPEGGSNLTVTATDPLGNTASNTGTAQIDTTAPLAPVVVITEDTNNDGVIANGELSGKVDVSITLPAGTNAGDVLTIKSGTTTQTITLTDSDIRTGTVAITLDPPAEGSQLTVTATLTDPAGNVSPEGKDSAQINTAQIDFVGSSAGPGAASADEGSNLVFDVRLSTASTIATTFDFVLKDGTATADDYGKASFSNGVSYDASTGKITVPAGVTSFTVTVPTTQDTTDEPNETVKLSIGGKDATGTIIDDDNAPTIEHIGKPDPAAANPNDVSAIEGDSLSFSVKLSNASSTSTTFDFVLKDGTATADDYGKASFSNGVSYDASTGKITVPAGVTSFTVTVPTTQDTIDEADETVKLSIGGKDATGTIVDNDGAPTIASVDVSNADAKADEGTALNFNVQLSNASASQTTFAFSLAGVTASEGDFDRAGITFSNGVTLSADGKSVIVPAGVSSFTVTVPTVNDTVDEPDETLKLTVGGKDATGTIVDNDNAPTIEHIGKPDPAAANPNDVSADEGSELSFTVKLSNASSTSTTFDFVLKDGTATADDYGKASFSNGVSYDASTGKITVPAGVTSFTVTVPTTQDTTDEPNETVKLSIGGKDATGTIIDDDNAPTIEHIGKPDPAAANPNDVSAIEGDSLSFSVKLSNASSTSTTFDFVLKDGTATADDYGKASFSNGVSYDASTGKITVPAGVTSFTVTVPTTQDTIDEADETVKLSIGGKDATGTIVDNDGAPTIASVDVSNADAKADEGTALNFNVQLSNASASQTTFAFSLAGVTASEGDFDRAGITFSNGVTLSADGKSVIVPAGVSSFTVTVPTVNDTVDEPDETLKLTVGGKDATGTIVDNDNAPTIEHIGKPDPAAANPNDVSADEGSELSFTVKLSNASSTSTTFDFVLKDGTATADDYGKASFSNGVSYDASTGKITVPAGVTSFTVTVPTTQDTTDEPNETVKLSIGGKDATGTIIDDDNAPTIEHIGKPDPAAANPNDVSAIEGDSLSFSVKLSNASSTSTTFDFVLKDGTATADDYGKASFSNGVSYDASTGKITVPAGVTSFTVTVPTTQDTIDEADETVKLSIGGKDATGTIVDNDGAPTIASVDVSNADAKADEGTALNFNVQLSNASASQTTFAFSLAGVTASEGDFDRAGITFSNGVTLSADGKSVIVPAGVSSFTVTVPTVNDTVDEPDETLKLTVGGKDATGTIVDNDNAPTIEHIGKPDPAAANPNDVSADEGSELSFTVKLSNASSTSTTFDFVLKDGTATADDYGKASFSNGVSYDASTGKITVPAGVTSFTVTVPTTQDTTDEPNETVKLSIGGKDATGTIIDDDNAPTIEHIGKPDPAAANPNDVSAIEGSELSFTVKLSNASSTSTTFDFVLKDGTATADDYGKASFSNGVSYDASTGKITVPAGVTSFTVTVPTTQDTIDEADETVKLSIGGKDATGTIVDNDGAPTIASVDVSNADAKADEGTALNFNVQLSNASSSQTTFAFSLAGVTASEGDFDRAGITFSNGVTLSADGKSVIVPAGVSSFTVTVPTVNDTVDEPDETLKLTVGGKDATGTIVDNDNAPTIEHIGKPDPAAANPNDVSADEGSELSFTVKLSNASSTSTTFDFVLKDGTATADDYGKASFSNGVSYDASTGKITVPAGVTSFTVTVPTTQDTTDEPNETVKLSIGGKDATGTIIDDDNAPTIEHIGKPDPAAANPNDVSAIEGDSLSFSVKLSNASSTSTTFDFVLKDGTATADDYGKASFSNGVSYDASTGKITVPAGVTSFTVTVPTTQDTIDEADETVKLSIGGKDATGTIVDNDGAPTIASVDVSNADAKADEGTALNFNVQLSNASASQTTFAFSLAGVTASEGDFDRSKVTFTNGVTLSADGKSVIVPAGVSSFTVTVPTKQDSIDEADETLKLAVGGKDATGTIVDNDDAPTISGVSVTNTGAKADEGSALNFKVDLSAASEQATSHSFSLAGVTASEGDFDRAGIIFTNGVTLSDDGKSVIVPAGVSSFTVTVPTKQDSIDEADETLKLAVGGKDATGTIVDNDDAPTISGVSVTNTGAKADEGSALNFKVDLSAASEQATSHSFSLAGVTASEGDFDRAGIIFTNGVTLSDDGKSVIVPAGVSSFTVIVPTKQDSIDEADETLKLAVGGKDATGTIVDNDDAPTISGVSVTNTGAKADEGSALNFKVDLSAASEQATSHSFSLAGVTASEGDFDRAGITFTNGVTLSDDGKSVIVPAGVSSFTVTVPTVNDTMDEADETLKLAVGGKDATGTIVDNDDAPTISGVSVTNTGAKADEGSALNFKVDLSAASEQATSHSFSLAGVTASEGDFDRAGITFSNGVTLSDDGRSVIVPAGVSSFTVTVPTVNDTVDETDETLKLAVGGKDATGTIVDNDDAPTISGVSVTNTGAKADEGTALNFKVDLSAASEQATSHSFSLAGVTASEGDFDRSKVTFTNGVTLSADGKSVIVPAGVSSFTVTVPTINDTVDEADETLKLAVGGKDATGTIVDNDDAPTISGVSVSNTGAKADEGSALNFKVDLSAASEQATSHSFSLAGVTASEGDFDRSKVTFSNGVTLSADGKSVIVPAGVSSFTVTVPTVNDTVDETDETLKLAVGGKDATGTIVDNDDAPTISGVSVTNTGAKADEGTALNFKVDLSAASEQATSHSFSLAGVTASEGDFDRSKVRPSK